MRKFDKPIRISKDTKEALNRIGQKGESYDDVIQKLIMKTKKAVRK